MPTDPLERLRTLVARLHATHEKEAWGTPTFRVREKHFASYLPASNHNAKGRPAVWIKATPENQRYMVAGDPSRWFVPPYVGPSGWIGAWLDGRPDWDAIAGLLEDGWRRAAPKRVLQEATRVPPGPARAPEEATAASGPTFFARATDFRAWLAAHADTARELLVGFRTVGSGMPSMTWPESVDEALCVGWIDGVRRRLDDTAYTIRFTPRRPGSIWSAVNVARVEALVAEGRMRPAGLRAFEARRADRTAVYAYEQADPADFTADELARFAVHEAGWAVWESAPPWWRRRMTHWVTSAKRAGTRARRFETLVAHCRAALLP